MRRLYRFARLTHADQWLVFRVFVLLGISRLAINVFSFRRLEKYLGKRFVETTTKINDEHVILAKKLRWIIAAVSPHTPWNSNCYPQALCAKYLLRRAGVPSTLYMGVSFKPGGGALQGHAWLRCGQVYVTGGDSRDEFGAIASFGM